MLSDDCREVAPPKRLRMASSGGSMSTTAPDVYRKDSMDRFGDDLCQHILSYLTLEDRFRCECVSTQWQRVVYAGVQAVTIGSGLMRPQILRSMFHKLVDLSYIEVTDCVHPDVDELITDCYHNPMNAINMRLNGDQSSDDYYKSLSLTSRASIQRAVRTDKPYPPLSAWMRMKLNQRQCENKIKFCYKLYETTADPCDDYITVRQLFGDRNEILFQKYRKFVFIYTASDGKEFDVFVENYKKTVKSIDVSVDRSCDDKAFDTLVAGMSRLEALVSVRLCWHYAPTGQPLAIKLRQLGVKCPALKRLSIDVGYQSKANFALIVLAINECFKRLTRLEMTGSFPADYALTSEAFNGCRRLTHLSLYALPVDYNVLHKFGHNFYDNIDRHLPRLRYLNIKPSVTTDSALNALAKLRDLQVVKLKGNEELTQTALKNALNACPRIRELSISGTNWCHSQAVRLLSNSDAFNEYLYDYRLKSTIADKKRQLEMENPFGMGGSVSVSTHLKGFVVHFMRNNHH